MSKQRLELADRIEYAIRTEDYVTLYAGSAALAADALRAAAQRCSADSEPYGCVYQTEDYRGIYTHMHVGTPPTGAKNVRWLYIDAPRPVRNEPQSAPSTLWGKIAAIYEGADEVDSAWADREWAKMRGYILPTNGTSTLSHQQSQAENDK